jgi:hypothetical protein
MITASNYVVGQWSTERKIDIHKMMIDTKNPYYERLYQGGIESMFATIVSPQSIMSCGNPIEYRKKN